MQQCCQHLAYDIAGLRRAEQGWGAWPVPSMHAEDKRLRVRMRDPALHPAGMFHCGVSVTGCMPAGHQ